MPVTNYLSIDGGDVTTTKTLLHEVLPLTGTIVSGTYGKFRTERNVKNYSHGQFQSVYDYAYLSSSANHIFDITLGYDEQSGYSGSANRVMQKKKINMYNQFAQLLLGYTGSTSDGIRKFESDLVLDGAGAMKEVFFVNFSRLLTKDQIKKGSFSITLGTASWDSPFKSAADGVAARTLSDASASVDGAGVGTCDGGEFGVLYDSGGNSAHKAGGVAHGVVFYQAGIAVISASAFTSASKGQYAARADIGRQFASHTTYGLQTVVNSFTGSEISSSCDALRHRIKNISFNNTTEINSKIYFCRVPHNQFNYSSNPTYTSGSKIVVKNVAEDHPVSYITTVGLYNDSGELLAVAKLSEPIRKDPTNDMTIRVRLDY